jgi:hypothetical protein
VESSDTPAACPECGRPITGTRTRYAPQQGVWFLQERSEPCGCTVTFRVPTDRQQRARGTIETIQRDRSATSARSHFLSMALALALFGVAVASTVATGPGWDLTAALIAALYAWQCTRLWAWQRLYEQARRHLTEWGSDDDASS